MGLTVHYLQMRNAKNRCTWDMLFIVQSVGMPSTHAESSATRLSVDAVKGLRLHDLKILLAIDLTD
jgi:hypothetical protein